MAGPSRGAAELVDVARFRDAMAAFPSGVTITTTVADDGRWWGFTASAFCSLSADPPLVLVCLAKSAECYPAFMAAGRVAIHIVRPGTEHLAVTFATRGADKFTGSGFSLSPQGLPVLPDAAAVLECTVTARYDGGDHTIVVGRVDDAVLGEHDPVVYFRRDFHRLPRPAGGDVAVVPSSPPADTAAAVQEDT